MLVKCLSWEARDVNGKLAVHGFGNNHKGESVYLQVRGFQPYFYVLVDDFDERECRLLKRLHTAIDFTASVIEDKINFYGFTNGKKQRFLKLVFVSLDGYYSTRKVMASGDVTFRGKPGYQFTLFETKLKPLLRFFHDTQITTTDTLSVTQYAIPHTPTTDCAHEIICYTPKSIVTATATTPISFRQATIDIETYSWDRRFPDPKHPKNVITHVAIVMKRTTEAEPYAKLVVSNGLWTRESTAAGVCHRIVGSEKALLEQLFTWISMHDPDIIYTYNGDIFDWRYIWIRAMHCRVDIHRISRNKNWRCKFNEDAAFESAAYGSCKYARVTIPGRLNIDVLIYIRREYPSFQSYSLNAVSTHFIGASKDPVSVLEMFTAYDTKNPELSCTVAEYCVQDTILPQALVDKLHILLSLDAMAGVTCVTIPELIFQGQSVKTFSQLNRKTMAEGYLIPDYTENRTKYMGATVLEPLSGVHFDPVVVLDFKSLYPSIIRAHGLCYCTLVLDPQYLNLPGVKYTTFNVGEDKTFTFAYVKNAILPNLLATLTDCREDARRVQRTHAVGSFEHMLWDNMQLAFKVTSNSIYGFIGAHTLPCMAIARTITYIGRTMIQETRAFILNNYPGSECIYGDSVTGNTPIYICDDGVPKVCTIAEAYKRRGTAFQVWSDLGWTSVQNVIRHELATHKKMFRVTTGSAVVDVTDDHSLLRPDGTPVSTRDIGVGEELMHCQFFDGQASNVDFIVTVFTTETELYHGDVLNCVAHLTSGYTSAVNVVTPLTGVQIQRLITTLSVRYRCRCQILWKNPTTYTLRFGKCPDSRILRIDALPYTEYVYDLTTANHHFQAGLGDMIVHNTDSVFVKLAPTIAQSIELGKAAAAAVTKMLDTPPIELEYEKVNCPMIMLKKKQYISTVYKNDPKVSCGRETKGVVSVRANTCEITKDIYNLMIDYILQSRDMNAVFNALEVYLRDVVALRLPIHKYSSRIKYNPPYKGKIAQQVIANKILARTGMLPEPSSVFMTVNIKDNRPGLTSSDKVELLSHFEATPDLEIDMPFYILNKIEKPLSDVINLIPGDHLCEQFFDRFLPSDIVARRIKSRIARLKRKRVDEENVWKKQI